MALAKRSVEGSYPLPSWMRVFRDVSVVIAAREGSFEKLEGTLRSIFETEAPWKEVLIVGCGSDAFKLRGLEESFSKVRVINAGDAEGHGVGNSGYREAQGTWILSLEQNSVPDINSWEGLCRILSTEPEDDVISVSILRHPRENLRQLNRASLIDAGIFKQAGFLVRRASLEKLGFFDDEIPSYASEAHWVARVFAEGGNVLHCPEACIIQEQVDTSRHVTELAFEDCCNQLLLILRYAPAQSWRDQFRRRLRDILVYTILHRSTVYLRAHRKALRLWKMYPEKIERLSEMQFRKVSMDWMTPYGFLG
ncbi:MAG: glycosyltransferase family 2 protein [Opitutales bacterium]